MALSTAVIYFFGAMWLAHSIGVPVATGDTNAITLGVAPFLAGDAVKLVLASQTEQKNMAQKLHASLIVAKN